MLLTVLIACLSRFLMPVWTLTLTRLRQHYLHYGTRFKRASCWLMKLALGKLSKLL
jgi:hypothetical protein